MTLRIRLALLLSFVVAISLLLAWVLARGAVLRPFTDDLVRHHLDAVKFVAEELGSGASPKKLGDSLGLEIRQIRSPPPFVRAIDRGDAPKRCHRRLHEGLEMYFCMGRRAPVAVKVLDGWLVVRRDFDVQAPDRRIGYVLLIVAVSVMGLSLWIAGLVTRPLHASVTAMERMAAGDLSHRLPESGGRELREVGRAFNEMADRVERVLRAEKELMAGISHELRTPLARLRLETEILREHDIPEKRLSAMDSDLAEIDSLIGELLEMSRLSLGERQIVEVETDLLRIAESAAERVPLEDHELVIEGSSEPIIGDHDRLVRVVANLIQNAGKYAPPGTQVRVGVAARSIEVMDRGPGVPQDELGRLFEPFYRGARSRSKGATGLGLGLMIARQIVLMHGGDIAAKNLPEGGFAITIELPADRTRPRGTRRPS